MTEPQEAPPQAAAEPTIVITFDAHGNMKLNSSPDVDLGKFVLASWLLARQAGTMADNAAAHPRLVVPDRSLRT